MGNYTPGIQGGVAIGSGISMSSITALISGGLATSAIYDP